MTHPPTPVAYQALALQTACRSVDGMTAEDAEAAMLAAVDRISLQVSSAKRFIGPDLRLIVLPEYVLTGYPWTSSPAEWRDKACVDAQGRVGDALAAVAVDNDVFVCVNLYERDPHFADLYFQTNRVIDPTGAAVLQYRRLISMFAPSPYDVMDQYLEHYGADAFFPVGDTEIGRLGAIASEEILYPEIARAFALKGAEVLLHPTSEIGSPRATPKDVCKPARAVENMAYVVSANTAGVFGSDVPAESTDGMSKIVDYKGVVVAEAGAGESIAAAAEIDVSALRRFRTRPGMSNLRSRIPVELAMQSYAASFGAAPNGLASESLDKEYFIQRQARVIETLTDKGVLRSD